MYLDLDTSKATFFDYNFDYNYSYICDCNCTYVCIYVCMYVCTVYVCMYLRMYVYMYVCMYVYMFSINYWMCLFVACVHEVTTAVVSHVSHRSFVQIYIYIHTVHTHCSLLSYD